MKDSFTERNFHIDIIELLIQDTDLYMQRDFRAATNARARDGSGRKLPTG